MGTQIARIMLEDKLYEILGSTQGEPYYEYKDAYYVSILAMDVHDTQTQYLISTVDYIPKKIVYGSEDKMLGKEYENGEYPDFNIGVKFYLTEFRDQLVLLDNLEWDEHGNPYILQD